MSYIDKYYEVKDELITYKCVVDLLINNLMKSNISIEETAKLMSILNFIEDDTCTNESCFLSKEFTNQKLKEALEKI